MKRLEKRRQPQAFLHRALSALFALSLIALAMSSSAHARDMQGRFGLGYNAQWANNTALNAVPGISLKYGFTRDLAAELVGGVATSNPANTAAGLKFFKNLFYENNLNFYTMIGAGLIAGGGIVGAQFLAGLGTEFFIPGLESLGFAVELGASLDNISGIFILKTMGLSFLNAGIHFYF